VKFSTVPKFKKCLKNFKKNGKLSTALTRYPMSAPSDFAGGSVEERRVNVGRPE